MAQEDLKVKIKRTYNPCSFDLIKSFIIEKPENFNYEPGQHVYIELSPGRGHPFSLVSSPHEYFLEFATIIRDESSWKQELNSKKEGDELILSGPYGQFRYKDEEKDILLIAGGIGITPFMGILRYVNNKKLSTKLILLYSAKTEDRLAYKEELDKLSKDNPNIKIVYNLTEEGNKKRMDKEFIKLNVENIEDKTCYVAGPPKMVEAINELLKEDFNAEKIKLDSFSGY